MGNQLAAALRVTPRQLYEASRLADRTGPAFMQELEGGRLLMLLATNAQAEPDLAFELDSAGNIVARQFLDLAHPYDREDELSDLSDEEPLPPPIDVSHARPAKVCEGDDPLADDGVCTWCGHVLPVDSEAVPEAA
jgi:hypothetical protein